MKDTLGFMSCIAVYASNEDYDRLNFVLDGRSLQDTLIVAGDFNALAGTDGAFYELCWSPWFWCREHQSLSGFCNIEKVENCRFLGP